MTWSSVPLSASFHVLPEVALRVDATSHLLCMVRFWLLHRLPIHTDILLSVPVLWNAPFMARRWAAGSCSKSAKHSLMVTRAIAAECAAVDSTQEIVEFLQVKYEGWIVSPAFLLNLRRQRNQVHVVDEFYFRMMTLEQPLTCVSVPQRQDISEIPTRWISIPTRLELLPRSDLGHFRVALMRTWACTGIIITRGPFRCEINLAQISLKIQSILSPTGTATDACLGAPESKAMLPPITRNILQRLTAAMVCGRGLNNCSSRW